MVGLDYGNARLRAMQNLLLSAPDYYGLVGTDSMDGQISALAATAYPSDVDAALPRFTGLRRFDEIVRHHMVRVLGPLPSYYENPRDGVVGLLTDRWDLHNLRTLFRVKSRFEATDEMLRMMVPIGRLGAAELNELAVQPSLRYVIDLMVAWRIPSRETAQAVRDTWTVYESSGDLTVLETALGRAFAKRVGEQLDRDDSGAAAVLRGELDEINVLTCLRVRAARDAGERTRLDSLGTDQYLPGGRVRLDVLADIAATDDRSAATSQLQRLPLPPGWELAISDWDRSGDLVALAAALRLASTRRAVGLFGHGDPLGYDIPVAFTRAQENEARNLRWIGRGIAHGLGRPEVEHDLAVLI